MPDIDPTALTARPSVSIPTPTLSSKSLSIGATGKPKSNQIPARIDLEPLYTALRSAISNEDWLVYKESTANFLIGRLNQSEYIERIDPILTRNGDKFHLHNQLIAGIICNVTREMPDQGPAPWVSANDKPLATAGSKPVSGDAAERRLKGDVMQLPARDRRRIKELANNSFDPSESITSFFTEVNRRPSTTTEVPASAGGALNNINFTVEIRKRWTQTLAVESGELPDVGGLSGRMLPFCYENGLTNGHATDAPSLLAIATETFIKETLTNLFSRTRSNGPGDSGSAGFGIGTTWIQTDKYRQQLADEEDAAQRGELSRDKAGLLPVEAKAASERGPLGMADMRLALEIAESGMAQFPAIRSQILHGYKEGELESWDNYTWVHDQEPNLLTDPWPPQVNGGDAMDMDAPGDPMDIDNEPWWEGMENQDNDFLDNVLDSCLTVNS